VDLGIDVGLAVLEKRPIVLHELNGSMFDPKSQLTDKRLTVDRILSPISRNDIGIVRCLGLNYKDHAAEAKAPLPERPNLFYKPISVIIGPNEPIIIPTVAQPVETILPDYEVELVIVIGKAAKDVVKANAMDYVLGYTVGNDVSFREHQFAVTQWGFSKSFDDTTPLGPCIVSPDSVDVSNLRLTTTLNGQILQDGTTSNLVFGIEEIVAYLSQGTTLTPGTVIYTGTPKGVGAFANPKIWLKNGDDVRVWVEHIGTLINPVVEEKGGQSRL